MARITSRRISYNMYIEKDSTTEEKGELFYRIFGLGFWVFLFSSFSALSHYNIFDFSFISFYLIFCIVGFLYLISTLSNFYFILSSVALFTVLTFCSLETWKIVEMSELNKKYLLKLPLIIGEILITISIFVISYSKIKSNNVT